MTEVGRRCDKRVGGIAGAAAFFKITNSYIFSTDDGLLLDLT